MNHRFILYWADPTPFRCHATPAILLLCLLIGPLSSLKEFRPDSIEIIAQTNISFGKCVIYNYIQMAPVFITDLVSFLEANLAIFQLNVYRIQAKQLCAPCPNSVVASVFRLVPLTPHPSGHSSIHPSTHNSSSKMLQLLAPLSGFLNLLDGSGDITSAVFKLHSMFTGMLNFNVSLS